MGINKLSLLKKCNILFDTVMNRNLQFYYKNYTAKEKNRVPTKNGSMFSTLIIDEEG